MTKRRQRPAASLLTVVLVALIAFALAPVARVGAQRSQRDHLTAQEVELVRDAQELDARTTVFIKAVERRMRVINGQTPEDAKSVTVGYKSTAEIDEAIENIDDTAQHNPKSPLLHKSVRKLSDAATRWLAQLTPMRDTVSDKSEREQLELAIDNAQQVVEAAKKLPAEEKEEKPGKKG